MPKSGDDDQFESEYAAAFEAKIVHHGLVLRYAKDRAGLDAGVHLFASEDEKGSKIVGQGRVWFQLKGLRTLTLSASAFEAAGDVAVPERVDYIRYWYAHPEPVYLVVYVEALDIFIGEDIRDIVERQWPAGDFYTATHSQKETTLRIRTDAILTADRLKSLTKHRSMRIDDPPFRGRPLGHRFDPLRSNLAPLEPELFARALQSVLAAHDFRITSTHDVSPHLRIVSGRLYETLSWQSPMFTEFGFGAGDDSREEAPLESFHGNLAFVVDGVAERRTLTDEERQSVDDIVAPLLAEDVRVVVASNMAETSRGSGIWRSVMRDVGERLGRGCEQLLGLDTLSYLLLVTTHVYLDLAPELDWEYVNFRY